MTACIDPANVVFSSHLGRCRTVSDAVLFDRVGEKASGLLKIPAKWTFPFIVLPTDFQKALEFRADRDRSSDLLDAYSSIRTELGSWLNVLTDDEKFGLIIRSSIVGESLEERGRYLSSPIGPRFSFQDFCGSIYEIVNQAKAQSSDVGVAVIVQRSLKLEILGHLSNETHLMPTRDRWMVEYRQDDQDIRFGVNSRREVSPQVDQPLFAKSHTGLRALLRKVGKWGNENFADRMHFEWGYKNDEVWLLQLDFEREDEFGADPKVLINSGRPEFLPPKIRRFEFFSVFKPRKRTPWPKLQNINDFDVGETAPKHRMYYCPGIRVETVIGNRHAQKRLEVEVENLTGGFAVIRTDVKNKHGPQHNLPRTDTIDAKNGARWMRDQCKALRRSGLPAKDFAFVMHRFIPAVASAWAFCEPNGNDDTFRKPAATPKALW